jgi:hypothetical protein
LVGTKAPKGEFVHLHSLARLAVSLIESDDPPKSPQAPPPVAIGLNAFGLNAYCETLYYLRTHPQQPEAAPVVQQPSVAPAQSQLGQAPQKEFVTSAYTTLVAYVGARQAHYAPAQTELADLGQRQAQVVSADARLTRVTNSGARGQFYALAQTQSVDLDHRQALFAPVYVPAANLGARRASSAPTQSQLSDRDARPALNSNPSWR